MEKNLLVSLCLDVSMVRMVIGKKCFLTMFGQVDAIGQVMGGPIVAGIASVGSAIAALVTSGLLLTPALFFIGRANVQFSEEAEMETEPFPAD